MGQVISRLFFLFFNHPWTFFLRTIKLKNSFTLVFRIQPYLSDVVLLFDVITRYIKHKEVTLSQRLISVLLIDSGSILRPSYVIPDSLLLD